VERAVSGNRDKNGSQKLTRIYISGPITGIENGNAELFCRVADEIANRGCIPINPHWLYHNHDKSWLSYMRVDIIAMMACDGLMMLPGFTESKGSMIEHELARNLGLTIEHFRVESK